MEPINTNRSIAELIQEHPRLGTILAELGIDCADCLASRTDTLEDVVQMYHLDMDRLLRQLEQAPQ
ncbi:MAG: DUF1858 domain-containing protein [Magnetococcales bacterium]|nr:DUF1858 domain-containing protein [Magnetococcales bacterium]